jgi:hypothetical protein
MRNGIDFGSNGAEIKKKLRLLHKARDGKSSISTPIVLIFA